MKMKMAGATAVELAGTAFSGAHKGSGKGSGETALKGSIEMGPGMKACTPKMTIKIALSRAAAGGDVEGHPTCVARLVGKSTDAASKVTKSFEDLNAAGVLPPILTASQQQDKAVISTPPSPLPPNGGRKETGYHHQLWR